MKVKIYLFFLIFIMAVIFTLYSQITAEDKAGEKCLDCHTHANSVEYKEWLVSDHAKSLKTIQENPKGNFKCLQCHSADYNRYKTESTWGGRVIAPDPKQAKDAVSCSSCHRHDSGIKHNLIMSADKLCVSCHKFDCG